MTVNVHIHTYGDLEMLREAVASVPEGIPIHIFDGRYADFEGDTDLTPGCREFCAAHPDCRYYAPPEHLRPFPGDSELREPVSRKSRWGFEHLPAEEWTLKLDADERLTRFDVDFAALDPEGKHCPVIESVDGQRFHIARLFKPKYWTPWVDDCLLPRGLYPRDTPLGDLARVWTETDRIAQRFIGRYPIDSIHIENYGPERPADYRERRLDQLERMGREDRFTDLKDDLSL